jgi:hypothetical protein
MLPSAWQCAAMPCGMSGTSARTAHLVFLVRVRLVSAVISCADFCGAVPSHAGLPCPCQPVSLVHRRWSASQSSCPRHRWAFALATHAACRRCCRRLAGHPRAPRPTPAAATRSPREGAPHHETASEAAALRRVTVVELEGACGGTTDMRAAR